MFCLLVPLIGCSLYQSDGKKILKSDAFNNFVLNNVELKTHFKTCRQTNTDPEFLNNPLIDEFSITANLSGFLDALNFYSYKRIQKQHFYCQSSIQQLNKEQNPFILVEKFNQLVKEYIK